MSEFFIALDLLVRESGENVDHAAAAFRMWNRKGNLGIFRLIPNVCLRQGLEMFHYG